MRNIEPDMQLEHTDVLAELFANHDVSDTASHSIDPRGFLRETRFILSLVSKGVDRELILESMTDKERLQIFADDPDRQKWAWEHTKSWADLDAALGPITWSWTDWLVNGMVTLLVAEPGAGKSALCLRVASTFIRGDPWPDGTPFTGQRGKVLWCEAEAAQALNLQRAKSWGLPPSALLAPLEDALSEAQLDDPENMKQVRNLAAPPDVRLVVVDSLRGANSADENSSDTMSIVKTLAQLARDTGKPVILTHHLRKKGLLDDSEGISLDRVRGSSAIVQPARVIWAIDVPDPQKRDVRRLSMIKSNVSLPPTPLGMRVTDEGLVFLEAPEVPHKETLQDRAADLLLTLLDAGPRSVKALRSEFDGAGLSWTSAERASERLNLAKTKRKDGWVWSLPVREEDLREAAGADLF
ncbi:MAG: AAA family ATPase [Anaerolineales bacterium]